jgi:hypothetical protein
VADAEAVKIKKELPRANSQCQCRAMIAIQLGPSMRAHASGAGCRRRVRGKTVTAP